MLMLFAISAGLYTNGFSKLTGKGGNRLITHRRTGLLNPVVGLQQLAGARPAR